MLDKVELLDTKHATTSLHAGKILTKIYGELLHDVILYRTIICALQYSTLTRPDIEYFVNKSCMYLHCPTIGHWSVVKRLLMYLCGTIDYRLMLHNAHSSYLTGYTDFDLIACGDDQRSISGHFIFFGHSIIS